MVGDDQEGGKDESCLLHVVGYGQVSWQHHFEDQVVLVADQIWYELAETNKILLLEELRAEFVIFLQIRKGKLLAGKQKSLTEHLLVVVRLTKAHNHRDHRSNIV